MFGTCQIKYKSPTWGILRTGNCFSLCHCERTRGNPVFLLYHSGAIVIPAKAGIGATFGFIIWFASLTLFRPNPCLRRGDKGSRMTEWTGIIYFLPVTSNQ